MDTAIIDYGMGNLLSVQRAFEKCGSDAIIITEPKDLEQAERIVLPGVGAFSDAMKNLNGRGWTDMIRKLAVDEKVPLLGICLGMQLLADRSFEGGETEGLGLIPGEVVKFKSTEIGERIPHVGWNDVFLKSRHEIFRGIENGTNYYFVHSYHYVPRHEIHVGSMTPYCGEFVSTVVKENIVGTQFHPEKSQKAGFSLIKNFLEM